MENRPRTGFATGSQTSSSNFSSYFALEPFLDLVNVSFRIHFGWHFYPSFNGKGIDSNGSFTESSSSGSLAMGGRVILSPFLSSGGDKRFYLALGVINSTVRVKNSRKYTSGSLFNQVNTEELSGSGVELSGGAGFEFFLVQNWSMQIEGGYTDRSIESFHYRTSTDVKGASVVDSPAAKDENGKTKGFHVWSPYVQIALNLNL